MTTAVVSKLEELIQPNKRGKVTNAQMIPALVVAIEAGSKEQLDILKEGYPEVFEASSTKYLNKKHSTAFIKIMNGLPLEDETPSETTEQNENQAVEPTPGEGVTENSTTDVNESTEENQNVENSANEVNDQQPEVAASTENQTAETSEEQVAAGSQEPQTTEQQAPESEAV